MRLLRKEGQTHGLLGQGILIIYEYIITRRRKIYYRFLGKARV